MDNLARLRIWETTTCDVARVSEANLRGVVLETSGGARPAIRAVSCLVAPARGDEVLAATVPDGRVFVLAVLARDGKEIDLAVDGALRIRAPEVDLVADRATVRLRALAVFAESIDSVCERVSQTVKRCFRRVEELDQLRAARLDYRAESEMMLRAKHVLASARALVKLDGERIHIG